MKILDDQVVYSTFLMIIGIQVWLTISPWERKGKGEGDGGPVNIDQMTHCISPVVVVDQIIIIIFFSLCGPAHYSSTLHYTKPERALTLYGEAKYCNYRCM